MFSNLKDTLNILIESWEYPSKSWKATNSIINLQILILKKAIWKTYKEIRLKYSLGKKEPIKPSLSDDERIKIYKIESAVIIYICQWLTYKEISTILFYETKEKWHM